MPEARDMLRRPNNGVTETYNRRQRSIAILPDNNDSETTIHLTPFRWRSTPLTGGGSGQQIGEPLTTTRRHVSGIAVFETPMPVYRRGGRSQNTPPSGSSFRRGRGGRSGQRSVLPSWYPRTPLGDITHVVRAIERRRGRLGDGVGQILGSPIRIRMDHQPADQDPSSSDAYFVTPNPKLASKTVKQSGLGTVQLMLTAIANKCGAESELQTPQKKLLNSIELVEKVVMEELHRLKRTPTAKKAEREKRVRTLMSMR